MIKMNGQMDEKIDGQEEGKKEEEGWMLSGWMDEEKEGSIEE